MFGSCPSKLDGAMLWNLAKVTARYRIHNFCIILFIRFCYGQNSLVSWQLYLSCFVKLMFVGRLVDN